MLTERADWAATAGTGCGKSGRAKRDVNVAVGGMGGVRAEGGNRQKAGSGGGVLKVKGGGLRFVFFVARLSRKIVLSRYRTHPQKPILIRMDIRVSRYLNSDSMSIFPLNSILLIPYTRKTPKFCSKLSKL